MKKKYKVSFLFIPLFLIFSHTAYAERPTVGISGVTGSSGTVSINYSASDSAENINTCSWQWSTDGTIWYPLEDSAIGNNGGKASGTSYINWNSITGAYNLADSSSSSVYFRMRSYNNQGLVWVSSAMPYSPYAGACWNERSDRLRTVASAPAATGEFAGYDSELVMTDSSMSEVGEVESLACELAAGATYLWQGTNGGIWKYEDHGDYNPRVYVGYWATMFYVTGLAWDGSNLWGCGSSAGVNGYVFKYLDPTIDSYNYWYWAANPVFSGLAWDGETLWSASPGSTDNIALHNMDFVLNISKIFTCDSLPYGLGSDGEYLYVTTWNGGAGYGIYKYNIPVSTYSTYGPFTIDNTPPSNNAPALSWTGESSYESNGLNPETGDTSTNFVCRVLYTDADNDPPLTGYPKVYILKGGTPVQTLTMEYVSGSYSAGAVYSTSTILSAAGSDYTYYFEALDSNSAQATGEP
ncbi:MAG: hypothetical protein ABIH68_04110, partial [bacterium]